MGDENKEQISECEEKWQKIESDIQNYLNRIGAKSKHSPKALDILTLSYDEIKSLTAYDCGEFSFILHQFALFLQQEYNFHKSKIEWADNNIGYIFSNTYPSSGFISKESKLQHMNKLAGTNNNMKLLLNLKSKASVVCTNLEAISFKVGKLADSLENLQKMKGKNA